MARRWKMQHDQGSIHEFAPTDVWGLKLRRSCSYESVNRRDGRGWESINDVIDELDSVALLAARYL